MIQSYNDNVIAITSYCDNNEKIDVLINNIKLIRIKFPNFKIALHANYPLSTDIQNMVDKYFYEDLNYTPNDKWIYYWGIMMNEKTNNPYFKKKFFYSIKDTGFSVFQQIKALTKYLIDCDWVMLINYDTSVEEINIEDYSKDYDLVLHYFPDHKAVSLIMMTFKPQIFYNKVARHFTYENWMKSTRTDQLNEERFFDMINESNIQYYAHDYKVSDKISNEPDFKKSNAPVNDYFKSYLLYQANNKLEIYLWDLLQEIHTISFYTDREYGISHVIVNENYAGGFEHILPYEGEQINKITITDINTAPVNIELKTKQGYSTRSI